MDVRAKMENKKISKTKKKVLSALHCTKLQSVLRSIPSLPLSTTSVMRHLYPCLDFELFSSDFLTFPSPLVHQDVDMLMVEEEGRGVNKKGMVRCGGVGRSRHVEAKVGGNMTALV
jgi:hypothetical protein